MHPKMAFNMISSNYISKIAAEVKKRNTGVLTSLIIVILLAVSTNNVSPSFSYTSSSDLPQSSFPYMPGLGPVKADASSPALASNTSNNTSIMGQINNITNFRTYENPVFGISMKYPAVWGAVELKSSPVDTNFPGSSIALFTAPLENATDTFREKALLSIQDFTSTGNTSAMNMTLDIYTNSSLNGYRNISDSASILESNATTLSGQSSTSNSFY